MTTVERDHVDWIIEAWAQERPHLDVRPVALVGRLLRVSRYLVAGIERGLKRFGLNLSEFNLLVALLRAGPAHRLSPGELSRSLMLTSAGMTKRIDRLEREGLVIRMPDPVDRRGLLVQLTSEGVALIDRAMVAHLENVEQLLEALEPRERGQLVEALRKMLVAFEDRRKSNPSRLVAEPSPLDGRSSADAR
jgi:DNA-binding MarR family transcriptional regulator